MASLGFSGPQKTARLHHGSKGHTLYDMVQEPGDAPYLESIEGRELRTKKCVKGWAGWTPVSDAEKARFQELVLCPRSDHAEAAPRDAEDDEGLVFLHDWLVGAAAEVKATTISSRNRNKFCVLEETREMASDAAKCRNTVRKKELRKIARYPPF